VWPAANGSSANGLGEMTGGDVTAAVSGNGSEQRPRTLADEFAGHVGLVSLPRDEVPEGARTMADRLAGLIGTIDSGGLEAIAARPGDAFSDYVVEKKRNGRL
jgi:hypothetical protein